MKQTFTELRKVMSLMGHSKWLFTFSCLAASLCVASLPVINSFMYQRAINGAVQGELSLLFQAGLLMITAILVICVVTPSTSYLSMYLAKQALSNTRAESVSKLFQLPGKVFMTNSSGELLSRLTNDLNKAGNIFEGEFFSLFQDTAIGVTTLVTSFVLDWRLAMIVLVFGIMTGIINAAYARPFMVFSDKIQKLAGESTQRFLDILAGNQVMKLFNIQRQIVGNFSKANGDMARQGMKLATKEAEKDSLNFALTGLTFLFVLSAGVYLVSSNLTDLGTIFAVISLKPGVDDLFLKLGGSLASLQKSLAGTKRYFEYIELPGEQLPDAASMVMDAENAVRLVNLKFSYDRGIVLKGLNMTIRKNQVTALVGRSGSGKSTLAKVLTATLTPEEGKIIYSGLGNLSLDWIRNQFAWVAQDSFLFDCTIAENIGYGNPMADLEEIKAAAKAANAHEFIANLPQGYDTQVGEQGAKLSGGQRQRIAIARAIIKNAPILLLDEATSALDSQSESQIQEALKRLMAGRTTVVIAHRLSTIKNADTIYVLDEGKIVDQGRWQELVNRPGLFQELYQAG